MIDWITLDYLQIKRQLEILEQTAKEAKKKGDILIKKQIESQKKKIKLAEEAEQERILAEERREEKRRANQRRAEVKKNCSSQRFFTAASRNCKVVRPDWKKEVSIASFRFKESVW